jgi:Flp pilus assembly protein TadD
MKSLSLFMILSSFLLVSCNHPSPEDGDQDGLVRAGDRVQALGDSSSAINVYKSALEKNPVQKLPLYIKLGDAYMNAQRLEEAKKTYEEALAFDENDEAKKRLGKLYLATGKIDPAISIFEGVILMHKDDVKALNGLGVAHDLKKDHQTAQDYYRKALSINEENNEIKSNMGLSLAFDGKYDEAIKFLQPIGEAPGATSKNRHNLALVYALSGNQPKAQELYAKDMEAGEINENLHAITMVPKPKVLPKEKPKKKNAPAPMVDTTTDPVEMFVREEVQ